MDEELALVAEARKGSREAFSQLLRLHQAQVRAYLGRFARTTQLVDDLAQETFLTAWRKLDSYESKAPFRIWLLGIARLNGLMHLREEQRRRAQETVPLASAVAEWASGQAGSVEDHDREVAALRQCIDRLPPHSAGIVRAHYFRGETANEMARQTGKTQGNLWVTLLRIRQALRECIRMRLGEAQP
jgi:RNA polymerase sigma-70 factor, ECF subfamily